MLDQFYSLQPKFCEEINRLLIKKNKVSHAYLIETNSFTKSKELVFAFAKMLLCSNTKEKEHDQNLCPICTQIDNQEYMDLMIIEPDGAWIKKEQLLQLQTIFKTKSYINGRRVYIIFQADKLNKSSANTLLKFLEEPEDGIVAILVTTNRYQVLNTILSRCQILSLLRDDEEIKKDINYDNYILLLKKIYQSKEKTLCWLNQIWYPNWKTKDDFIVVLTVFEILYKDYLEHFDDHQFLIRKYGQLIDDIIDNIFIDEAVRKIKIIDEYREKILYNVNLKLWLDSFIIQFSK